MPRAAVALLLLVGACAHSRPAVVDAPPKMLASRVEIPVHTEQGNLRLQGAVFWVDMPRPPGGRPVVVFSHGSPMTFAEQREMTPFGYQNAIRWFVDRGYVVVAALRHGFGDSQGRFSEGVDHDRPDYTRAGKIAARDIRAVLDFLKTLPGLDLDRVVLAGHSAGGFGSLALLAEADVRARAVINFAGGKGAQWLGAGERYTDGIVAAAAEYGRSAHAPALWIYADNDRWFSPPLVTRMFQAYKHAGAPVEIERVPPVGTDGHALFTQVAMRLWTGAAERFLAGLGLPAAPLPIPLPHTPLSKSR